MDQRAPVVSERVVIASPLPGHHLALKFAGESLVKLDFVADSESLVAAVSDVAGYAVSQLDLYFRNPRWQFDIALLQQGSEFQQRVWQVLREIPLGTTVTYGQLAWRLDSSARAVGGACRANPLPIIVPCHRVVAATGVGGFMGHAGGDEVDIKMWLLKHEQQGCSDVAG